MRSVANRLELYNESKYGSILTKFEKDHYIELQIAYLAAVDSALVHIFSKVPEWRSLAKAFNAVCNHKDKYVIDILQKANSDVYFIQEAIACDLFAKELFEVISPEGGQGKQDSVIALRKCFWKVTQRLHFDDPRLEPGDLVAVKARHALTGKEYVLASFHGDTNGIATIPVLQLIFAASDVDRDRVIIGADTNAHSSIRNNALNFNDLIYFIKAHNMTASNSQGRVTKRNMRTFYQAQSLKGKWRNSSDMDEDPKDQIIVGSEVEVRMAGIDFTGNREETDDLIPNEIFPSDHALVWAEVVLE